jgi:hypothetical protein
MRQVSAGTAFCAGLLRGLPSGQVMFSEAAEPGRKWSIKKGPERHK